MLADAEFVLEVHSPRVLELQSRCGEAPQRLDHDPDLVLSLADAQRLRLVLGQLVLLAVDRDAEAQRRFIAGGVLRRGCGDGRADREGGGGTEQESAHRRSMLRGGILTGVRSRIRLVSTCRSPCHHKALRRVVCELGRLSGSVLQRLHLPHFGQRAQSVAVMGVGRPSLRADDERRCVRHD